MNRKARLGLLPLYLKLYDERSPEMRQGFEQFLGQVTSGLEAEGVEVIGAPVCQVEAEFRDAVRTFEESGVDIIASLHLAYSPSLESADALSETNLPLIMLDTTMDYEFGPGVNPERISYNHGIHGVQDLASVLRRRKRAYRITAGHVSESDVLARAAGIAKAAYAARMLRSTRALRIGDTFAGMGDFAVAEGDLKRLLGIEVEQIGVKELAHEVEAVTAEEIEREVASDKEAFRVEAADEVHRRSVRVGLGVRRYLEQGKFDALSMNFLAFDSGDGPVNTVPFLEASKAMSRGTGYAGEGDVLTAALVGALCRAFGRTTFTEIFCPDWKGDSIFLSHMGEINPDVAAEKPLVCEKDFPYTDAENPAIIACAPASGPATLVNLSPGPDETFRLIIAPAEVLEDSSGAAMRETVRGWIRPSVSVAEFLEEYSHCGGTHHSALMLGGSVEAIEAFASFAGIESVVIQDAKGV